MGSRDAALHDAELVRGITMNETFSVMYTMRLSVVPGSFQHMTWGDTLQALMMRMNNLQ